MSAEESSERTEEVKEIKDSVEEDIPVEETKKESNSDIVEEECLDHQGWIKGTLEGSYVEFFECIFSWIVNTVLSGKMELSTVVLVRAGT